MATDFQGLLAALTDHKVDFVVIGGVALIVQGSARTTTDLDICYSRQPENIGRLADALAAQKPTLRGAPPDLPLGRSAAVPATGPAASDPIGGGEVQALRCFAKNATVRAQASLAASSR